MTAVTVSGVDKSWQISRVEQMLTATKRLPSELQRLFDALYVKGLSEASACEELHMSPEALNASKQSMFRSLKAAAS